MKMLSDGTIVIDRTFYYLLDWNDRDYWKFMTENFNKKRLMDLTLEEYKTLWEHATKEDTKYLKGK